MATATKATKGSKATKATKGEAGRPRKEGLRKPQIRILAYLAKAKGPADRATIATGAPCDVANCVELIGSHDDATRKANDAKHYPSLRSLGYVRAEDGVKVGLKEGSTVYSITASGKAALAKALKEG